MIRINTDQIILNIDKYLSYQKYVKYQDLINNSSIIVATVFFLYSVYVLGIMFLWINVIAKLLGYKHGVLSEAEEINKIEIQHREKQLHFFFWFLPTAIFILFALSTF